MNANTPEFTVYYDGACALCNGEMTNLKLRNTAGRLRFVDIAAPGFDPAPTGKALSDMLSAMHVQAADGRWLIAIPAFEAIYGAVGLHGIARGLRNPLLARWAGRLYPWVVRNRYRLPRRLVQALFEGPTRRAAERAASARCDGVTCRNP